MPRICLRSPFLHHINLEAVIISIFQTFIHFRIGCWRKANIEKHIFLGQNSNLFFNIVAFNTPYSNDFLTFRHEIYSMISLWPKNWPLFRQSPHHWSEISFQQEFFWSLRSENNRWWSDLANMVDAEAIRSEIHAILTLFSLICETVHCVGERALVSSSFDAVFFAISAFKRSNNAM